MGEGGWTTAPGSSPCLRQGWSQVLLARRWTVDDTEALWLQHSRRGPAADTRVEQTTDPAATGRNHPCDHGPLAAAAPARPRGTAKRTRSDIVGLHCAPGRDSSAGEAHGVFTLPVSRASRHKHTARCPGGTWLVLASVLMDEDFGVSHVCPVCQHPVAGPPRECTRLGGCTRPSPSLTPVSQVPAALCTQRQGFQWTRPALAPRPESAFSGRGGLAGAQSGLLELSR